MTDRVDTPLMGGLPLTPLEGTSLWIQSDGIVAAGTETILRMHKRMLDLGYSTADADELCRDAAMRMLDGAPKLGCMILAAGAGARLRPVTEYIPKPLVTVAGRTLIDHILDRVEVLAPTFTVANLHHMAPQIEDHLAARELTGQLSAQTRTELHLRGPAGSLHTWADKIAGCDDVLVVSGDCFHDIDLEAFVAAHHASGADCSVVLTEVDDPGRYGVAQTDADGWIVGFVEKPQLPAGSTGLVSCGMYLVKPHVLEQIPQDRPYDFGADLIPLRSTTDRPVFGYVTDAYWCDVGAPAALLAANLEAVSTPSLRGRAGTHDVHPTATVSGAATLSGSVLVCEGATIEVGAHIVGPAVIGPDATVGAGAQVIESTLMQGATVAPGQVVERAIVTTTHMVATEAALVAIPA